jgi:multidrug resistance efflux pump
MSFVLCVIVTLWLWQRQGVTGTVTGEVEAVLVEVPAGVDGELRMPPSGHYWELFDEVQKGQPLAYLDDRLILARMETVRKTAEQLEQELVSTEAEFKRDQDDLLQRRYGDVARLQFDVEQRKFELLQLEATMRTLNAQIKTAEETVERMRRASLLDPQDLRDAEVELEALKAQYQYNVPVVKGLQAQRDALEKQLKEYPQIQLANVESILAPIRTEREVQEKLLEEIQVELDNCVIRAPMDGVISMIYRYPGQRVGAADPILTIANKDSDYVVGWVREQQRIALYEGMEVGLRIRNQPNSPEYTSSIEKVSPQVAPLPLRRLADQNVMEFATWIRIPIPRELKEQKLRPGQLVQVIFRSPRRAE